VFRFGRARNAKEAGWVCSPRRGRLPLREFLPSRRTGWGGARSCKPWASSRRT